MTEKINNWHLHTERECKLIEMTKKKSVKKKIWEWHKGVLQKISDTQFQALVSKRLRDVYLHVIGDSWLFECAGRAAAGEHRLNNKRMNDSSGSQAEVGTRHARPRNAPFTTRHYLNWKEYLYQLRDQKLMETVMHQLSYIKMSIGKRVR